MIIAFYKPFGVLSQFTANGSEYSILAQRTLAEFGFPPNVYPVGRLDADSEGFLLLSDEARIVKYLLEPRYAHPRSYLVQVEGIVTDEALNRLKSGVVIQRYTTLPCKAWCMEHRGVPHLPERVPPIRKRVHIPTSWIGLELTEGKNRQVRRMTAAVGLPTLRLIRIRIGALAVPFLEEGRWRELTQAERKLVLQM
jgi:23S rRNA pseudouridine2457 synthase